MHAPNSNRSDKKPRTGFVFHPEFLEHGMKRGHPESAARLKNLIERLEARHALDETMRFTPREAPVDLIARVHDPAYIRSIADRSDRGRLFRVDSDTIGGPATYRAARLAVGAVIRAIDAVMAGQVSNAFCAVRPPGHHAERDRAMGFCFFNNVAIGARYLLDANHANRVAIVDWDVHHGNGTQQAFYDDPSVFYLSIHQSPHYPYSGAHSENGVGRGRGFTLNIPVAAGAADADYIRAFKEIVCPALDRFRPQFILISAGFDAHRDDPLSDTRVTEAGFAEMTRLTMQVAADHCRGRVVSALEGGYHPDATPASVEAHLRALREGSRF